MSVSVEGSTQDVELNLAPIIDCFTVLITYLLVTASFITLSAMDVGVSATGSAPATESTAPPPLVLTLELKTTNAIVMQIKGGPDNKNLTFEIQPNEGWNMAELTQRLLQAQRDWPTLDQVSVSAEPTVIYKDIVKVIHEVQNTLPKVFISG